MTKTKAHLRKIKTGRKAAQKQLEKQFPFIDLRLESLQKCSYEEAHQILAKHFQWWKEKCLYVDWEQKKWMAPMKFTRLNQMVMASFQITESLQGCKALAEDLDACTLDIDRFIEEFSSISNQRFGLNWEIENTDKK